MPGMSGLEVCAKIRERAEWRDIPIIFLTALTDVSDKVKGFAAGGVDYITKPFQLEEVLARVASHLALRQARRDLEESLRQLREVERLRDSLTHMIVHDLRTPLTAIEGYLDLLLAEENAFSDKHRGYIDRARRGSVTLIALISSLLDVNRLESGEMPVQRERCDLCVIASQAKASLEGLTVGRAVSVEEGDVPVFAIGDPQILQRVIANLLGNALKFTPKSGSVTVRTLARGATARVEVRDTGYGIASEYLDRVFDKFAQVEARAEHKSYSSGLGLTFCKLAIEAHGGRIGVDSEVGKGSTFWFELSDATPTVTS